MCQLYPLKPLNRELCIDAVCQNEGVYTIRGLIKVEKFNQEAMKKIPGLCFRNDQGEIEVNPPSKLVAKANLEVDLPGVAWDLLPPLKNIEQPAGIHGRIIRRNSLLQRFILA